MELFGELSDLIKITMRYTTSADKAYAMLRQEGYEFTRQEVREKWREVGEKEYWSTVLRTWGTERTPPRYWTVQGTEGMRSEYQMRIEYTMRDVDTGEIKRGMFTLRTDELMSFDEAWDMVRKEASDYALVANSVIVDWQPAGIIERP